MKSMVVDVLGFHGMISVEFNCFYNRKGLECISVGKGNGSIRGLKARVSWIQVNTACSTNARI